MDTSIFAEHPVIPSPTPEQCQAILERNFWDEKKAAQELADIEAERRDIIRKMEEYPFECGWVPRTWHDAMGLLSEKLLLVLFGGNGSGKTWFMCWYAIKHCMDVPNASVLFLHESEKSSQLTHQEYIYHYLPNHLKPRDGKEIKTTVTTFIRYQAGKGFANHVLTFPNGSKITFGFYNQNVRDYEGPGFSLVCADENLPLKWLKTLTVRLFRRKGKFLWSYTPVDGITQAIKYVQSGAKTVTERRAALLPADHVAEGCDCRPGHLPYIRKVTGRPDWGIMHFFSEENPMSHYDDLARHLRNQDSIQIERRAYGWCRDTVMRKFPRFGEVHIVEPDEVPERMTHYFITDPAQNRNMFCLWAGVTPDDTVYVYREWPDVPSYGEWALPSEARGKFDGEPGPAQPDSGLGVLEYKMMFLEKEGNKFDRTTGWDESGTSIELRQMDPRAATPKSRQESGEGKTLLELFEDEQERDGVVYGPAMYFQAAPGLREEEGIRMVNDLLYYDTSEPVSILNPVKLKISSACGNLIWALYNYTGKDGKYAACKDPADCLRYLISSGIEYLDPEVVIGQSGRGW